MRPQLVQRADRARRVQVVVHRGLELVLHIGDVLETVVGARRRALSAGRAAQSRREIVQILEGRGRLLQDVPREVERLPVVPADQAVAQRARREALRQDVVQVVDVAEALAHLPAVDLQELGVDPVVREGLSRVGLALRDLALVVREDVVLAAGVDVDAHAEVLHRHRRGNPSGPKRLDHFMTWCGSLFHSAKSAG